MTSQSDTISGSPLVAEKIATEISASHRFCRLVRRELWEHRSIYLAPLIVGGISLFGSLIALIDLPRQIRSAADPMRRNEVINQPFVAVALALMAIDIVVAVIYCLDALYGERRDRSVLFWKSLPVSDRATVLAKAAIPILVLPIIASAITVTVQLIMLLASSAVLAGAGMSPSTVWAHIPFFKTAGINFYHLVVFHGIWYAPFYGWFLMVSAWSKRTPFLWAVVPPLLIGIVEKIAFNSTHFATLLLHRFAGGALPEEQSGQMTMEMLGPAHAGHFLFSPGMWFGLLLTAAFLFAASRLRRSRAAD
jgi:ABC-2 type transport system permease protein